MGQMHATLSKVTHVSLQAEATTAAHLRWFSLDDKSELFEDITVADSWIQQFANDVKYFHLHVRRALRTGEALLENIASGAERKYIQQHLPPDMHVGHVVASVLVWRRSTMKVLIFIMFLATLSLGFWCRKDWRDALTYDQDFGRLETYSDWRLEREEAEEDASFISYSSSLTQKVQYAMTREVIMVLAIGTSARLVFSVCSIFFVVSAEKNWVCIRRSSRLLAAAWFLVVAVPFAITMVPTRMWIDWTEVETMVNVYRRELHSYIQPSAWLLELQSACDVLEKDGDQVTTDAITVATGTCQAVKVLPKRVLYLPLTWKFWTWSRVDLRPAHKTCALVNQHISNVNFTSAMKEMKATCREMEHTLNQQINDFNNTATPEIIEYFANNVKTLAGVTSGLAVATRISVPLFPAALSIAPGILRGSLALKMLIPQSTVPGMFILILPWIYAPLVWALYSISFQLLGNYLLLLGLSVLAARPVIYYVVGKAHDIDTPMTDQKAAEAVQEMDKKIWYSTVVGTVLVVLALSGSVFRIVNLNFGADKTQVKDGAALDWTKETEAQMLEYFFLVNDMKSFTFTALSWVILLATKMLQDYYMTNVAGVDWMSGQMIEFREKGGEKSVKDEVQREYRKRMTSLVDLDDRTAK